LATLRRKTVNLSTKGLSITLAKGRRPPVRQPKRKGKNEAQPCIKDTSIGKTDDEGRGGGHRPEGARPSQSWREMGLRRGKGKISFGGGSHGREKTISVAPGKTTSSTKGFPGQAGGRRLLNSWGESSNR